MLFTLPDLILKIIQSFFLMYLITPRSLCNISERACTMNSEWCFFNERFLEGDEVWRNLMNTTKQAAEMKRKAKYLILKERERKRRL